MATAKRFEDLPLQARAHAGEHGNKFVELYPELKDTIAALYPDEATSRKVIEERRAREREEQEQRRKNRLALTEKALAGGFGKEVRRAVQTAVDAAGGDLTPTTVQKAVDIIKEHEKAKRSSRRKAAK